MDRNLFPDGFAIPFQVLSDIDPKCQEEIHEDRGSKGCARKINKVKSYSAGSNTHFLANISANTKGRFFKYIFKFRFGHTTLYF